MDPNWCFYWGTPQNHSKLYILKYLQQGNRWLGDFSLLRNIWPPCWGRTPANSTDWWRRCCVEESVTWTTRLTTEHEFGLAFLVCVWKWGIPWYTHTWPVYRETWEYTKGWLGISHFRSHFQTQNFHCQGMEFQPGIFESNEAQHWYFQTASTEKISLFPPAGREGLQGEETATRSCWWSGGSNQRRWIHYGKKLGVPKPLL